MKDAFDEFVTKWVEDDLQRRLGPNQDPDNVPEEEMAIMASWIALISFNQSMQ